MTKYRILTKRSRVWPYFWKARVQWYSYGWYDYFTRASLALKKDVMVAAEVLPDKPSGMRVAKYTQQLRDTYCTKALY